MLSFLSAATVLASTLAFSAVSVRAFNSTANNNLAVYWGQGIGQKPLANFCTDATIDIIPIGFVNLFPDELGANNYPGINFGNACGGGLYTASDGVTTQLLASCADIEADIKTCQANGKKVLLSLGGATATGAYLASDTSAVAFADFLWGAFGPSTEEWTSAGNPRPFGDAVVDGFDFDIESLAADIPTAIDFGYAAVANEFRRLFANCTTSTFYLSAAPQCIVPDGHLADAISNSIFDFIFVQFYNTSQCSARAYFDSTYGQAANGGVPTNISYDAWISWIEGNSANAATKVYIGLPAAPGAANADDYLNVTEARQLITNFKCKYPSNFGGVMLWEATYSENNQINGLSYAQNIKPLLMGSSCLSSTAAAPASPASSSWTVKFTEGISSWPPASTVSAPATLTFTLTSKSSTTIPGLPAIKMTTVSVAQGATWSSDPSLTLSSNAAHAAQATNIATFTGAASRPQAVGATGLWLAIGVLGLAGVG